ncbi:Fungal specific transcription factor [Cordyceps militaris]|uniref:Fungal specific transcription factor n=1 Tax=Cordyceps militaris TaxID=73501 RepID=A0A2H4SBJ5_CORMI|nr:Fungal specific transcription factor [Cordyceps militaris]
MIEGWGSGPESHKSTTTGVENPTSHKIKLNVTTGVTTGVEKGKVEKAQLGRFPSLTSFRAGRAWPCLLPAGGPSCLVRKKKDRLASPRLLGFLLMSGYFIYDGILCYLLYRVVLVVTCRHSLPTLAGKNTAITPPFNIGTITEKTVREIVNINFHGQAMNVTFGKSDSSAAAPRQIRFVHNQGQPPSKRRRINAARRKTRCDGERPTCSTCSKNGHKCLGYPDESKRDGPDIGDDNDHEPATTASSSSAAHHRPDPPIGAEADRPSRATDRDTGDRDTHAAPTRVGPRARPSLVQLPILASPHAANAMVTPPHAATLATPAGLAPSPSSSSHPPQTASTDDLPSSPTALRRTQNYSYRIPYFRYFGPTAIVPGFKQMVVAVRDRRLSTSATGSHPGTSPLSTHSTVFAASSTGNSDVVVDDPPSYDPNAPGPVHPLLLHLVEIFFAHVGCNFPFLKKEKALRHIREKRVEPILVDSICALAARFSDSPSLTGGNDKMPRTERGHVFAQRAKQATVDTFACPSVEAVQACLLMAYEGFGANQDSALWMYLGLAIRMALDLGLQKRVGIKYQGEKDPWNTQQRSRGTTDSESPEDRRRDDGDLSETGQRELEQERIDTFWAVFVLDRIISSGTGRPVTLRDDDFELPFPEASTDPNTGWPTLFPVLVQIVHLYGRVSDVLNNIHHVDDLTQDRWSKLSTMEHQLTRLYKNWGHRLQFNVNNFKHYLKDGQGNIFILLHLWFHALFINLHQPTVLMAFGELRSELQLLPDSRELSMSSAKTICDILSFADLIDPKSFIGNPFTSQPIYIAAGAFLMESSANASEGPSREASPPPATDRKSAAAARGRSSRHSMLASAATQNYQRCYNSLQEIHGYWGGIKYILTALDQKSKGTRDVETYTTEEYESTKSLMLPPPVQASIGDQLSRLNNQGSPIPPGAFAWSFSGTANSPNSNFTAMYQAAALGGGSGGLVQSSSTTPTGGPTKAPSTSSSRPPPPQPVSRKEGSTPPGNMIYDPIRPTQTSTMFPPAVPQPNLSALRHSPHQGTSARIVPNGMRFESVSDDAKIFAPPPPPPPPPAYAPTSQHATAAFDAATFGATPPPPPQPPPPAGDVSHSSATMYGTMAPQFGTWGGGPMMGQMDGITFNSRDIDVEELGLQQDLVSGSWLDLTTDMLGLFETP